MMFYKRDYHFAKLNTPKAFPYLIEKIKPYWSQFTYITVFLQDNFLPNKKISGIDRIIRDLQFLEPYVTTYLKCDDTINQRYECRYLGNLKGKYDLPQAQFEITLEDALKLTPGIPRKYPLFDASINISNLNFLKQGYDQFHSLVSFLENLNKNIFNDSCSWGLDFTVGMMVKFHSDSWSTKRSLWCELMVAKQKMLKKEKPLPENLYMKVQGSWHPLRTKIFCFDEQLAENQKRRRLVLDARSEGRMKYDSISYPNL